MIGIGIGIAITRKRFFIISLQNYTVELDYHEHDSSLNADDDNALKGIPLHAFILLITLSDAISTLSCYEIYEKWNIALCIQDES